MRPADDPRGRRFWRLLWTIVREGVAYRFDRARRRSWN